ncbi:MAG: GCN5-like N-acetyltransferase [Jatrophihabitantaceae bacterium]|nr:GCN5-like N-acetyltransferase [Jatrophihabitantaceae bacterium]
MTATPGPEGYETSTDPARIDVPQVHRWLSEQSYWAAGRSLATVESAIEGSRCYSAFSADGAQAAFARIVTDGATFAWICDVFVGGDHRGRGLGRHLVGTAVADLTAMGVARVVLATRDAHEVYRPLGFGALPDPSMWMLIDNRRT